LNNGAQLQPWMIELNAIMSKIRVSIEWSFGIIIQRNKFIDFATGQQLQRSPLAKHYNIAVFLSNCHACLNGGIHLNKFRCRAPTIDEYLL